MQAAAPSRYRWTIVALLFFATTVNYIDRTMLGLLAPTLGKELGWSENDYGNIVTAFSWFGVNMLGVGLHSYGFMDQAFVALVVFVASQLILIGLAYLPKAQWRSAALLR